MESTSLQEFNHQLVRLLPIMRIWALGLTKHPSSVDDLIQDVATKVLANRSSFDPGSNFTAWVHRIMVNQFISSIRMQRKFVTIEKIPDIPVAADQQAKLDLDRVGAEIARLPDYQRELLCQLAVEERSYEDLAKSSGCAIGTLKSRVHRIRAVLRARLEGGVRLAA